MLELPGVQDRPQLFSTFLMWLLADLFHDLPEVGDLDKPKLVFFFDEAHLLFNDASKSFLDAIQQTVRLIRSKGVGVFFVTQSPKDVPADVLAQLGNRVQHALRALHPGRREGAQGGRSHLPEHRVRPRGAADPAPTGEAVDHRAVGEGRADPGGLDPDARAAVADGALGCRAAHPDRRRVADHDEVRTYVERESASEMLGKAEVARTEAEQAAAVEAENAKVRDAAAAAEKERLASEAAAEKARVAAEKQAAKDAAAAAEGAGGRRPQAGGGAEHGRGGREVERLQVGAALGRHGARPRDHPLDLRHVAQALTRLLLAKSGAARPVRAR